ncbi:MAG: hypothetical protein KGJ43_03125 [Acidobacteriota bacterium]|nr:hypothetical protein [Acidobacteriota bacterium]
MTHNEINDLLIVCAAVFGLAAFVGLIVAPAWSAYSRTWERMAALFLSLYVLAALVGIGALGALVAIYFTT